MKLLLCTDMDRTVIPNGMQTEADNARLTFSQFTALPSVTLAYVTGRHLALMQEAVDAYQLPDADFAITDVGTRIYQKVAGKWQSMVAWEDEINQEWQSLKPTQIQDLLTDIDGLTLQEPEKQNPHKISFYIDLNRLTEQACLVSVKKRLEPLAVPTNLIWSIDETTDTGLLDILPPRANKLHAIEFLQQVLNYPQHEVVFAGDSGNDLEVLISPVQSVLVANATEALKAQALSLAKERNTEAQFYQAVNNLNSANDGHYSAGVLQGVAHYLPEFESDIRAL